jgi:hypothetical protein
MNWRMAQAFDLAGITNTLGCPSTVAKWSDGTAVPILSPQTQRAARSYAALRRADHYPSACPHIVKLSWLSYPISGTPDFWPQPSVIYPRSSSSPCAGGGTPKPHPVAGFGCKVSKYSLGFHETLQTQPGSNLTAARRFNQHMAARNSRCHQTLNRGLEQCFPTLKSVTFSLSISSLRN